VPQSGSSRPYAQAAFAIAQEQGKVEDWGKDLESLAQSLGDPDLQAYLTIRSIPAAQKRQIIEGHTGEFDPLIKNLALLLLDRGKINITLSIAREYRRLQDEATSIEEAYVVTAVPLTTSEQDRITERLRELTGKQLRVSTAVDEEIIGGFVARVGDKVLDGSTRSQIQALRDHVRQPPQHSS
jgi:F-type H+-transporting ATPase subunit delta